MSRTAFLAVLFAAAIGVPATVAAQPNPNQPDTPIDVTTRTDTITSLAKAMRAAYVYPDVGDAVAKMLEERNGRGEYNGVTSAKAFSAILTKQMSEVAHNKHLGLVYVSGVLPAFPVSKAGEPPPSLCADCELREARASNYGFEKAERLSGNVGYLKFNSFSDAEGGDAVAAGAMALHANTDALIIDLRDNHGGGQSMCALLASYFFSRPVRVSDFAFRIAGTRDFNITQTWTLPYVPGQRYVNKNVYLLTSPRTFSVAEAFTDILQSLKRATVVGETTGGGANGGGPYRIGDHFFASMPMGHLDNPVTKTNWEGKGVTPDVNVPETAAFSTAHRLALQHLIEKTTDSQTLAALKHALEQLASR